MHSEVIKSLLTCLQTPKQYTEVAKDLKKHPKVVHRELRELEDMGLVCRTTVKNPRTGRGQPKTIVVWAISSTAGIDSIAGMD